MNLRKLAIGLLMILLVSLAITTYVLWEDGRQFVAAETVYPVYPEEVAEPSYLDSKQLNWKSAAVWQQYMQAQRAKALTELMESKSP